MKSARLWLGIFLPGYAVAFAMFATTVFTTTPYGDLTRIGQVPESQFGWQEDNLAIPAAQLRSVPVAQADVLVIGDSFSVLRAWQAALTRAGLGVATTHWDDVGALCTDVNAWIRQTGFHGRYLILESVERVFATRIEEARTCTHMGKAFVPMKPATGTPLWQKPPFHFNADARLNSGVSTWWNGLRIRMADAPVVIRDGQFDLPIVQTLPVTDGCRQFSHRLCSKGLFLVRDADVAPIAPEDIDFAQAIAERLRRMNLDVIWMVVPDKTTVYVNPAHGAATGRLLAERGLGPDLFADAQQARMTIRDLYWPNDTHWSPRGHLHFGQAVLHWMQGARQATPAP